MATLICATRHCTLADARPLVSMRGCVVKGASLAKHVRPHAGILCKHVCRRMLACKCMHLRTRSPTAYPEHQVVVKGSVLRKHEAQVAARAGAGALLGLGGRDLAAGQR